MVFKDEHMPVLVRNYYPLNRMVATFQESCGACGVGSTEVKGKWYTCLPRFVLALKNISLVSCLVTWFIHHNNALQPVSTNEPIIWQVLGCKSWTTLSKIQTSLHEISRCSSWEEQSQKKTVFQQRGFCKGVGWWMCQIPGDTWQSRFVDWFRRMVKCIECGRKYFEIL